MPNAYNLPPGTWLQFLLKKLDEQCAAVAAPMAYYNGHHRLAWATAKFRQAFSRYFPPLTVNWMKLIVQAPVSRLDVQGFRFDPDPGSAAWQTDADDEAWRIWQFNNLDAGSRIAHTEAIKCGVCYLLVTPPGVGVEGDEPLITIEHPSQFYVQCDPTNKRNRLAAIKRYVDEIDGYVWSYVYLPDRIYKWRSVEKYKEGQPLNDVSWTSNHGDDPVINNTIGVVPGVPLENNADLLYGGRSDLEDAMPIQDAINKYCLDMMVGSEFHAFPQRYAIGWEKAVDAAGKPIPGDQVELMVGVSRFLRASNPDAKFGQLSPGQVANYIEPIRLFVEHMGAVTQTPTYYLEGRMANLSAEALQALDQGLVDRCNNKINRGLSDGWEEAMRVAFLAKGDQVRGRAFNAEAIWGSPSTHSIPQLADAVVKLRSGASLPIEFSWELLGFSAEKIRQGKKLMNLPDGGPPPQGPPVAPTPNPTAQMPGVGGQAGLNVGTQRSSGLIVPSGR